MLGGLANYDYYVEIQCDLLVFIRLVILPQKSQRGEQKLLGTKLQFCDHLLAFMSLQTHMIFSLDVRRS